MFLKYILVSIELTLKFCFGVCKFFNFFNFSMIQNFGSPRKKLFVLELEEFPKYQYSQGCEYIIIMLRMFLLFNPTTPRSRQQNCCYFLF